MTTTTPQSRYKRKARRIIRDVIEAELLGNPETLTGDDLRLLRAKIRAAYPFGQRSGWRYVCWLEEVRLALGFPVRTRKYRQLASNQPRTVMPSMRAWAAARGIRLVHS